MDMTEKKELEKELNKEALDKPSLGDQLQAIRQRLDLTPLEKKQEISNFKGTVIKNTIIAQIVDKPFTVGDLEITIVENPSYDLSTRCLTVWVKATRNGKELVLDLPFIYVNPPISVRNYGQKIEERSLSDGQSVTSYGITENPFEAVKQMIADTVSLF